MEPLKFVHDNRPIGALFVISGVLIVLLSLTDPEVPHWFGMIFAAAGVLFVSSKSVTILDAAKGEIAYSRWQLFFLRRDTAVDFSSVVEVSTKLSTENRRLAVSMRMNDGSKLLVGNFDSDAAYDVARQIRECLGLGANLVDPEAGLSSLSSIEELSVREMGDTHILTFPGVSHSVIPAMLALATGLAILGRLGDVPKEVLMPVVALGLVVLGVAATFWRRSRPIRLEIDRAGLTLYWPSLLGTERTSLKWDELTGFSVGSAWVNRRFRKCPVVVLGRSSNSLFIGDGLKEEDCHTVAGFLKLEAGDSLAPPLNDTRKANSLTGALESSIGLGKAGLIRTIKAMLATSVVASCLLSALYPAYCRHSGIPVFPVAQVAANGGASQLSAGRLPGVVHVSFQNDPDSTSSAMKTVTFYGAVENIRQSSEGGYSRDYFYYGVAVMMGLGIVGWLLAFVSQFLRETRLMKMGAGMFVSMFVTLFAGSLIFWPLVILGVLLGVA